MLSDDRLHLALADDLDRLDRLAPDGGALAAAVAACPGWSLSDLLGHVGVVHRRTTGLVRDGEEFRWVSQLPPPPPVDEVVAWRRATSRDMADALRTADLEQEVGWIWGSAPARAWLRRMVHETAVHRWDAEVAAGANPAGTSLDDDVAVDTIQEQFDVFTSGVPGSTWLDVFPEGTTVQLHAAGVEPAAWHVRIEGERCEITRGETAAAAVTARGPASDVALVLVNRRSPDVLEVDGDPLVLQRYLHATAV